MSNIWIPLQGPSGMVPKAPAVPAWASPGYHGVTPDKLGEWFGLRCDGLVVVDCDSQDAAKTWVGRCGKASNTYVRKTPRGFHFIYRWTDGSPTQPGAGFLPGLDIRAGSGSQIVFHADGYSDVASDWDDILPFDPSWLPEAAARSKLGDVGEGWTEMPQGRGNVCLTAIAGAMRKQGMAEQPIRVILRAINKLTMTESPMPKEDVDAIARSVCRYAPDPDVVFEVDESDDE